MQGKTFFTTVSVTARYRPCSTSLSSGSSSVVPGVTQSRTGVAVDSVASPSATTTRASQGVADGLTAPAGLRSQGRVRRLSTICGSRSPKAPSALAGGKLDRIWSVGIV